MDNSLSQPNTSLSKVMVVDDDEISRAMLCLMMEGKFDVISCASGKEALVTLDSFTPDLILMDAMMPELDGYETCRQVRIKFDSLPIIFVTAQQSLEEHLKAYDAGGNDLILKPVDSRILIRKATLAIHEEVEKAQLVQKAKSMQEMALNFLSTSGENSILLNFVRDGGKSKSYEALAQHLVEAESSFGVECCVMLSHSAGSIICTSHGEPTHLERTIMDRMSGMGRLFEFKRQFIFNYDHISILVTTGANESLEKIGHIRDNTEILAESAEGLYEIVTMRMESMALSEQIQIAIMNATSSIASANKNHSNLLADTRILLQDLVDKVESTYSWLNTTNSQEEAISGNLHDSVDQILTLLSTGNKFEEEIAKVVESLKIENKHNDDCLF